MALGLHTVLTFKLFWQIGSFVTAGQRAAASSTSPQCAPLPAAGPYERERERQYDDCNDNRHCRPNWLAVRS